MNKLQSLALLVALLTVALAPGRAAAAVRPYALTVTPAAGGYLFEGNQHLDDGLLYSLGLGYNFSRHWGAEGVANLLETETEAPLPQADIDLISLRLDVLYHFRPDKAFVPYLAAGFGGQRLEAEDGAAGHDDDLLASYGLGFKLFFNDSVALRADVRHILDINNSKDGVEDDVFHNLAYSAGLLFQLGGATEAPRETPRTRDTDGDGVVDQFDRCPDTRLGVPVDGFGCPTDSDRDGVPDFLDKCPGTAAGVAVDANGCPKEVKASAPVDSDGDGVEDGRDRCPDTPAAVQVDANGCPKDSDGDGVADFEDRCPETPAGTAVDTTGCPAPPPAAPAPTPASMTLELQFTTGEAAIRPAFARDLQAAADFIKAHPEGRILIEGHTDSIGSVESNLALSKARAAEVRRTLIENYNLEAARIETAGYGEARPVADNATPDGRMRNRRVVITVVPER